MPTVKVIYYTNHLRTQPTIGIRNKNNEYIMASKCTDSKQTETQIKNILI